MNNKMDKKRDDIIRLEFSSLTHTKEIAIILFKIF
jgi:hypothetical protein